MGTIAKPRESSEIKVKEDFFDETPIVAPGPKSTPAKGGMGRARKIIADETIKNAGQYNEQKTDDKGTVADEPTASSAGDKPSDTDGKADGKGFGEAVSLLEQEEQKRRDAFSVIKRKAINQGAEELLSCLEPSFAQEYRIAAMEHGVKDIGIYILGILNRLAKEVDFNNPDFEVEWEEGVVGYTDQLFCNYCGKEIVSPTKLKQKFCSNLCAKYYREQGETGVIYPDEHRVDTPSPEDEERAAYEAERKRTGGE